jgi:hypothetical protein
MQIYQLQRLWRFRLYLRLTMYLYDVVKEPTRSRVRCAPVMVLNAFQSSGSNSRLLWGEGA